MICHYSINFFWHGLIKTTQARFNMANFNPHFGCNEGSSEYGIGITLNQYNIRSVFDKNIFYSLKHQPRLFSMGSRSHVEIILWIGQTQLIKKNFVHIV